jgi:hypothetical protein
LYYCFFAVGEIAGNGNAHRDRETVILNVGGINHRVKWETIDKFPKSRLQNLKNATSNSEFAIFIFKVTEMHFY